MKRIFFLLALNAFKQAESKIIVADPQQSQIYIGGNETSFIDIFNDGKYDYKIFVKNIGNFNYAGIAKVLQTQFETDGTGKAISLNKGAPIGNNSWEDSAIFYSNTSLTYYFDGSSGGGFTYAGIKIVSNGNTYYGYIEIDVQNSGSSCMIGKIAYEDIPGKGIKAGDGLNVGLADIEGIPSFFATNEKININTEKPCMYGLYALNGSRLMQGSLGTGKNEISLLPLPAGIYVISISKPNGEAVLNKKVLVW